MVRPRHSMREKATDQTFELAPMSTPILTLTAFLLALPVAFLVSSLFGAPWLVIPAGLMVAIYAWVWLRFRPSRFLVHRRGLQVIWPLKARTIPAKDISHVRVVDTEELKREIGWGMRIGAGGLWGGFGLLRTKRRGLVQMYISRTDRFVWIELSGGRPWLITPERPEAFVRALSQS